MKYNNLNKLRAITCYYVLNLLQENKSRIEIYFPKNNILE